MEQLQTRILLKHVEGATIAYFYNRESFDLLSIERQKYDETQFIEIGNVIEYEGRKYIVKNINFKMEKELYKMNNDYGINMDSPTDLSDYNCQIGIFLDNE